MSKPVCAVVGVGPGNGAAFAKRFSDEGFAVALLARTLGLTTDLAAKLPDARAYPCDVTDSPSVEQAFGAIRRELGEVDVLVYNAGSGVWGTVEEIKSRDLELAFRVNASGLLICAQAVIPAMKANAAGIVVIGPADWTGRPADGSLRPWKGRAAKPRRIDGAASLARGHSRIAHHRRWRRRSSEDARMDEGQAG
jgi:NAD(P)-dependent dehydrogenase (short-subunit alcohol dehydrogenase family)